MWKKILLWLGIKKDAAMASFDDKPQPRNEVPAPLFGLALGKQVDVNTTDILWLKDELNIDNCPEHLSIQAVSKAELGFGRVMERFYASADVLIQVIYTGNPHVDNVEELTLFSYDASHPCHSEAAIEEATLKMRATTYEYGGQVYNRVFEDDHNGLATLAEVDEDIDNSEGKNYNVYNHMMLFSRELSDGTHELLLTALEDHGSNEVLFSIALGKHVNSTDLRVSKLAEQL
tara:strand:+ start:117129 stop:117824 length:696 start_codon:yes stop_codon:yes gene_type:complete